MFTYDTAWQILIYEKACSEQACFCTMQTLVLLLVLLFSSSYSKKFSKRFFFGTITRLHEKMPSSG